MEFYIILYLLNCPPGLYKWLISYILLLVSFAKVFVKLLHRTCHLIEWSAWWVFAELNIHSFAESLDFFHARHPCISYTNVYYRVTYFSGDASSVDITSVNGVFHVSYRSPGQYELTCSATDADGLQATHSLQVSVKQGKESLHAYDNNRA